MDSAGVIKYRFIGGSFWYEIADATSAIQLLERTFDITLGQEPVKIVGMRDEFLALAHEEADAQGTLHQLADGMRMVGGIEITAW